MKCHVCEIDKLSKEFPTKNVDEACTHPPYQCLRCVIKGVAEKKVCPYKDCGVEVKDPVKVVEEFQTELDQLYPSVQSSAEVLNLQQLNVPIGDSPRINVVMLTGDSTSVSFNPQMTIEQLKSLIKSQLHVDEDKQQLMYNDRVLEEYQNGKLRHLVDYGVQPFHSIHLMVLLLAIPSHFNHVIFDLFWGYPAHGQDFLDASCLVFSGKNYQSVVDYGHRQFSGNSIWHSGDVMDNVSRKGHHTIEVHLKQIPSSISHLYFTLSAWNSSTISHFPNPTLKFFEASNKTKDLCSTTFTHARNSQAVIMCSVVRSGGQWKIMDCGKLSAGNAKYYNPLISTIQSLI